MIKPIFFGLSTIALWLITLGVAAATGTESTTSGTFAFTFILAALLLFGISLLRKWKIFPYLPYLGLVVSAIGYVVGDDVLRSAGLVVFAILVVVHEFRIERRYRSLSATESQIA